MIMNNFFLKGLLIAMASLFFLSCAADKEGTHTLETSSVVGNWKVIKLNGEFIPDFVEITFNVDSSHALKGKAGCNSYFGQVEFLGDTIKVEPVGATMMSCDEIVNDWEYRYLGVVSKGLVPNSTSTPNQLELVGDNTHVLLEKMN